MKEVSFMWPPADRPQNGWNQRFIIEISETPLCYLTTNQSEGSPQLIMQLAALSLTLPLTALSCKSSWMWVLWTLAAHSLHLVLPKQPHFPWYQPGISRLAFLHIRPVNPFVPVTLQEFRSQLTDPHLLLTVRGGLAIVHSFTVTLFKPPAFHSDISFHFHSDMHFPAS